ncbi:MAG: ribose-phosphate diphosphokinase [Gammaproteobacteria bacterium]|nr:ribose-phosphate diphosphokinase [Gammaproteobacteria bacterium]MBU1554319.1 ribose-phosphate diphosphokinase [Gammaproteobacteria bacterium]MBU2072503.1 ribose-phosphate diphosphokinase [Gammaproteobacteria bacterium]MBU2181947.1 ribose-phosphate diphosphokinase [Gammaproteobacteria bacterium]MBU2204253.1 ribose-phosphate diphosphokinase [Gammaproteobacteria bacterium]
MENCRNMDFYVLPPTDNCGYQQFCFGAGENHIRLTETPAHSVKLLFRYQGDASVMQLLLLTDALKRAGAASIDLFMPYFPGARQDRVCNPGEPLSVKVYASLINAQQFNSVTVFDPHSDVTAALLNKVQVVKNHAFVQDVVNRLGRDITLISPDAGANKKIFELSAFLGGVPVVRADKIRDVRDGKIIATEVFADSLHGATCVIIDDICAGGRTFIELAKKLKEKGAESIVLVVSHYEGSAKEDLLRQSGIDKVYCTDSLAVKGSEFVSVTAVTPFLITQGEVK